MKTVVKVYVPFLYRFIFGCFAFICVYVVCVYLFFFFFLIFFYRVAGGVPTSSKTLFNL